MTLEDAEKEGYTDCKIVRIGRKRVIAGLMRFAFTTGLVIGIDSIGYHGRWCFHTWKEAKDVLSKLLDVPEDLIIPGNWIKYKGQPREFSNPKYIKDENDNTDSDVISALIRLTGSESDDYRAIT